MTETMTAPAGNPVALAASVDRYEATENAIAAAADELLRVVLEGSSVALETLNDRALTATGHLGKAHGRYQGTRSALRSYTVELAQFHETANATIDRDRVARHDAHDADRDLIEAAHHARSAALNPQDQATLAHWETQAHVAGHRRDAAENAMAEAAAEYARAAEALDQAAHRAMGLIDDSFDSTNDSRVDKIKAALAAVGSFLANLADWATDFFATVLGAVLEAVAIFVVAVLVAIAVVALLAVIVALLAQVIAVVALLVLYLIEFLLALYVVGVAAYDVATVLGVDDQTRIRIVLGALAVACPALGYLLVERIASDLSRPTPAVSVLDPASLRSPDAQSPDATVQTPAELALADLEASIPDSVDDFLGQAGAVDTVGGTSQSVVDIAKIVHEDGTVSWIVTLPSTKDWVAGGDKGAVNDLDADLLLVAFPELRSQYERAALEAMAQAGIGAGEPVLVTGWSLGGILAGHLAETGAGGYHYAGVVVAGSPIDHMNISADVPVIQVKHWTDPVHRTDMIDATFNEGLHITLWDGPLSGIGLDLKTEMLGHSADQYRSTLAEHVTARESIDDAFTEFFVVDDPNHTGQPTIEHQQYAFSE